MYKYKQLCIFVKVLNIKNRAIISMMYIHIYLHIFNKVISEDKLTE